MNLGLKLARKIGDASPFTKELTGKFFSKPLPPCKGKYYNTIYCVDDNTN